MDTGPSVVGRVGSLLRALAAREPDGVSTTALAAATDLPRATSHRLLSALRDEGLVERDEATGSWHLGPECFLLGAAATSRHDITPIARATVLRLARETGESAFFSVRRGDETVCLLREDGSFPIRSHVLHEGIRFPLGVASAGLVLLAFLGERERTSYLAQARLEEQYGAEHTATRLRSRIDATRSTGYAVNPGLIVPGSWGLGAAVFDAHGEARWALSLTGIEARLAPPRQQELGELLLREAHALTGRLAPRRGHR
ncbi:helix-turn-helix domain-containing protein [Pimelobacter simplex]|uniref:Transcriptional regulator, IclR family n=1 Tax=Nocardioides simplex TaxID=2045 RepID=A0A0A1DQ72_NOCSI|nr:IclR family transcriptional regulator [Pimelobacter simplex]AIY19556.1 Transcriptional regulator, IclR family [Pimelobacter simplex]MCG8150774.1 helix-turn-helix domain-containing protein [Pimelobacter simplex]GEB15294.1 putative IclR-family regulatory protein [Pimelobacter simplex]SFM83987.1 transcriptional regulator, IclR family [Pimelobacter simplex]